MPTRGARMHRAFGSQKSLNRSSKCYLTVGVIFVFLFYFQLKGRQHTDRKVPTPSLHNSKPLLHLHLFFPQS